MKCSPRLLLTAIFSFFIFLSTEVSAQANFFECAKDPAKCREGLTGSVPDKGSLPKGGEPVVVPNQPSSIVDSSSALGLVPTKPAVGNSIAVTTNRLDLGKKTSDNEVWISFEPSVTVQERQFCRIIDNSRVELSRAAASRNQIKVNQAKKNLVQSLNSLLPDGSFSGWIMRAIFVSQAADGSAEVLMELPCGIYVGSNACDVDPKKFYGTAPEGSRVYTELAKITVGDFVIVSGSFEYADKSVFDRNKSVATFGYMKSADHCRSKEMPVESDFFGAKLNLISVIK